MSLSLTPSGRAYCPETGRFLQKDPLARSGTNPYVYANNNPGNNFDPTGLLSLDDVIHLAQANRPAGISDNITSALMVCLLWKESGFDPQLKNSSSTATGIAQILYNTANDIQDKLAPQWGGSDPFYILAPGQRLVDFRTDPRVSIYAAYLYLQYGLQNKKTILAPCGNMGQERKPWLIARRSWQN